MTTMTDSAVLTNGNTPYVYGYQGETNTFGFSPEEKTSLLNGLPVAKKGSMFYAVPYGVGVSMIIETCGCDMGSYVIFAGFSVNDRFFSKDIDSICEKFTEDINHCVMQLVPSEESAHANAQGKILSAPSWEREKIEELKNDNYYNDSVEDLFIKGKNPQLVLYRISSSYNRPCYSYEKITEYLKNPKDAVENAAQRHIKENAIGIYKRWIQFNMQTKLLAVLASDKGNKLHTLKAISESINDQKTVKLELVNGNKVSLEGRAVKSLCYVGKIWSSAVKASDREFLIKEDYSSDIKPEHIVSIKYKNKVLYHA